MQGLTAAEVLRSRQEHGENVLTPPRRQSMWRLYLEKYQDPMVRILLVAAIVSLGLAFVKNDFIETIGIILAVVLATTVGFYFERDAARKFDVLTQMGEEQPVKVMRRVGRQTTGMEPAGKPQATGSTAVVMEIARREVVVGDVVIVETGDEVPADGRLVEATDLQVDESSLTGELLTTKMVDGQSVDGKSVDGQSVDGKSVNGKSDEAYPKDLLLRSSMVMGGTGRMVVTAVGDETEIGHVARQATEITNVKTPLNQQLDRLAGLISKVGSTVAAASFVLFLVHDMLTNPLWHTADYVGMAEVVLKYFMMAVTLIVMAVPEGLPMAVTLALALNMRRMLKSNNLVRKLQASETMGAVTVICTDKTGTLTENRMTVAEVVDDQGKPVDGQSASAGQPYLDSLYQAIALNSTATHDVGNPTEQALLRWLVEQGVDYQQLRADHPITAREPFSTERKYMTTTCGDTLFIKGAPEVVMRFFEKTCEEGRAFFEEGGTRNEEREMPFAKEALLQQLREWQQHAMRTLAIAWLPQGNKQITPLTSHLSPLTSKDSPLTSHLSPLTSKDSPLSSTRGLAIVAISDPLRPEVPEAIRQCRQAGIDVKIVTGDTRETALEIGRLTGVTEGDLRFTDLPFTDLNAKRQTGDEERQTGDEERQTGDVQTITGAEFAALTDEEALRMVQGLKVMSRARPTDKQRLVSLLQQCGEVVAVTGDGTNDAPALNRAHVGLSLGSGTSVAKEASDITLIDDSFRSIVHAVMWGRSLYKNIQRFIFFQLIVNVTALLLVLAGGFIGTEMPLTITQILWVNLIMDTFAAMALASLPPSREVMQEPPRSQQAFIISRPMMRGIAVIGGLFFLATFALLWYFERVAGVDDRELTIFFTIFVMLQWWNLFNARQLGSHHSAFRRLWACRGFLLVLALVLAGQWAIVTFGGRMFRTVPLDLPTWLAIIAATSPVLWAGETYRAAMKSQHSRESGKQRQ